MRGAGRRAWGVLALAAAVPVVAVIACSGSQAPPASSSAAPAPSTSATVDPRSSVIVGDAAALLEEIAAYADATPVGKTAASAGSASPKINRPALDPSADSPNGKCLAANAPAPDFRAAAQTAAQETLICYEYALKRSAPSPAHLEIMLDVNEDGRLRDAAVLSDDFADDKMRACTVRKLRETERFPSPKTGCGSVTKLPLTFLRADGGF
jgi:hypothetical protein